MIPPRPPENATGSERSVFSLLQKNTVEAEAIALSSLNLSKHEYQRWGEIDFVLVAPTGILAIEVKGGKVTCRDGIWRFEDRWGRVVEKAQSPLTQAQGGYSSLLNNYLKPRFGTTWVSRALMGFCMVCPNTRASEARQFVGGPEMPFELVGTLEDCTNVARFQEFIGKVFSYWRRQAKATKVPMSSEDVRQVTSHLRPSFDRVQPVSIALAQLRQEQFALTEDQYRFLDYMEGTPRVLCLGGAGCGKTFLAVECLRRDMDLNPILVTGTPTLASHLRSAMDGAHGCVFSYEEFIAQREEIRGRFSTLIVDEGQQITNPQAFSNFSEILGKELAVSRWRWFSDPNLQVTAHSNFYQEAHETLTRWANVTSVLRENCRNTPQIIRAVEFMTGQSIGATRIKGSGPEVVYGQAKDASGLVTEAATQVKAWLSSGDVVPGQIVLLSALPIAESSIRQIALESGVPVANWRPGWDLQPEFSRFLGAATIESFRGLESPFVILCDLGNDVQELENSLYIGMTRANFGVFIACEKDARERIVQARMSGRSLKQ